MSDIASYFSCISRIYVSGEWGDWKIWGTKEGELIRIISSSQFNFGCENNKNLVVKEIASLRLRHSAECFSNERDRD